MTGAADEGLALLVFIGAGAFADEHEFGVRIADAEDDLLASLLVQRTACAVAEIYADEFESFDRIGDTLFRFCSALFEHVLFNNARRRDGRGLAWGHLIS